MRVEISKKSLHNDFVKKLEEISGQKLLLCNQCGKCSAGCPMASAMDVLPNQIIRFAQLGLHDEISVSKTPWLCASCLTCSVRCPRGVDLAAIMEAVRLIYLRKNKDFVSVCGISNEDLQILPQIALVSSFRKHTA